MTTEQVINNLRKKHKMAANKCSLAEAYAYLDAIDMIKLINKPVETTNEQPKLHYLINYTTMECLDEGHYNQKHSKVGWFTDDELNSFVEHKDNVKVTYLG